MTDTNSYTPEKVTNAQKGNVRFQVPIYQRLFVWEAAQINQLLSDLYEASQIGKPYHIGIITVVERDTVWEIVDGQQRLTFLLLLAAQLRKFGGDSWKIFLNPDSLLRIDYVGRQDDQTDLENLATKDDCRVANPHMQKFVDCFNTLALKTPEMKTPTFANYVYKNATFLVSRLSSNYTAFELNYFFEKLNASGRQLEPEEMVKGMFFAEHAAQWNALIDFSEKYKNYSENNSSGTSPQRVVDILNDDKIDHIDWNEPNRNTSYRMDRAIISIPMFLLHVLQLNCEASISLNTQRLVETFKEHNLLDAAKFMTKMKEYRCWLDENIIHITDNGLEFWRDDGNGVADDRQQLRQFQSMLYVSSGDAQRWILEAYLKTIEGNSFCLKLLKDQDAQRHTLPLLDSMRYPAIDRYWFWKLDYILWEMVEAGKIAEKAAPYYLTEKEIATIKNYTFRTNRSIEHLHPQTSEHGWNNQDLHGFGNLAMISSSFNSTQSNDSVGVKFARLSDTQIPQGKLESIKLLLMFKCAQGQESGWTTEAAEAHQNAMWELLQLTPLAALKGRNE